MKKLLAALIFLVMVSTCTSTFGYILVYRMTMTIHGAENTTGKTKRIPLKGYLIMDSNFPENANLIIFGKDATTERQKVYLELGPATMTTDLWDQGERFQVLQIVMNNENFELSALMRSKLTRFFTGPSDGYQRVPLNLDGFALIAGGEILGAGDTTQDISGTAIVKMTLWPLATRWANGMNLEFEQKTQEEVVANAEEGLEDLNYNPLNE